MTPPEKALREADVVAAAREFSRAFSDYDLSDDDEVRQLDKLNAALKDALEAYDRVP